MSSFLFFFSLKLLFKKRTKLPFEHNNYLKPFPQSKRILYIVMTSEPFFNANVIDAEVQNSSSGTILASYIIRPVQGREPKRESYFSVISMQRVDGNHINLK